MFEYVKVVKYRKMEQRELLYGINVNCNSKRGNIISYVDFSRICHVIRCFTDLNQAFVKEDIISPLLSSSRAIERKKII